tara:strand:- start:634 stop:2115 length:1482 start_codon:yes stop_codon:yes gene_type:complete
MSQYKGNQTNGVFNPTYKPSGETNTPINVVSTSMEIKGELIQGYQATYANGTSKWTARVHQDQPWDTENVDRSTFTGQKNANGSWSWTPTTNKSIQNLANDYVGTGVDYQKITKEEINAAFYNNQGNTLQQKLSGLQANALKQKYGNDISTINDGQFENLPGIQGISTLDIPQTPEDFSLAQANNRGLTNIKSSKDTRTTYGNYYYPQGIASNKQDRIVFTMRQSTGTMPDPGNLEVTVKQRKTGSIEGSVTLPIQSGIKDINSVSWQGSTMNPIQAFGAAKALDVMGAAGTEGESVVDEAGKALNQAATAAKQPGVAKAINTMIAAKAVQTQNLMSRATGAIANPNMELLFDAPALRAFDFTFTMSPRDAKEAAQIRSIINFFKQGMSVKTTSTNIFLKAPNYFEIDYISYNDQGQAEQHPSLNVIKTCALLSCSVDYTPNQQYMTYSDPQRSMVAYTMNLQFNELDPIYENDYHDTLGMVNSESPSTRIGY